MISSTSFGANAGKLTLTPLMFIVFLEPNLAVFFATVTISVPTTSLTSNSNAPSSTKIIVPGLTSLYKSLYVIVVFVSFPIISSFTKVNSCPS